MSAPAVSVVIPAQNAAPWLRETLASVLAQTVAPTALEVVVVDDGSRDGTAAVARSALVGAAMPWVVLEQAAAGPGAARNRGWRHAVAPWIQFLDADDLIAPTKLAAQLMAANAAAPDVAVIYSPWTRLIQAGDRSEVEATAVRPTIGDDPMRDLLDSSNFLQLGCALFSRTWLERVDGFDPARTLIEDVDLLLRIASQGGRFMFVDTPTPQSFYRQHPGSLSRRDARGFVEGCVRNARFVDDLWTRGDEMTPARAAALTAVYLDAARHYAGRDRAAFDRLFDRIEQLRPGYAPPRASAIGLLARLVGARRAERAAAIWRRARSTA